MKVEEYRKRMSSLPKKVRHPAQDFANSLCRDIVRVPNDVPKFFAKLKRSIGIEYAEAIDRGREPKPYICALMEVFEVTREEAFKYLEARDNAICGV